MTTAELDAQIAALRKAGRYAEAANLCLQVGDHARASELYAAIWDWPAAIRVAEEAGLLADAYRHALAAGDREAIGRLLQRLPDRPEQALQAAKEAERRGRLGEAARLHESCGAVAEAAALYERAGELFEAARCCEADGRYRDAGRLYERSLAEDPKDGEAALRLGRILAHFGRYEPAARALQSAARDPERERSALTLLVACFHALRMNEAAAACLERLRRQEPSLPASLAEFLKEHFDDAQGLAGLTEGDDGRLAGRYRVVKTLGAGATGKVLLARDGFYERDVAIKVLSVGGGTQGRDAYVRFAREARIAANLDHPNVVRVFEFNPAGPFLVMEYMAGGTLEERLEDGPPPLALVRHVARSTLLGLEAVHRRGVIHRDLKPANIFFGAAGDVKLGDFGVAHLLDLGTTLTGAMMGTLAYMAPEQMTGASRPDATTDLYAFGCILYRLLSGSLPFPGPDFVTQHLEQTPPPVSARRAELGERFDALLRRLLAKAPTDRPTSVEEVRLALDAIDWGDPMDVPLETTEGPRDTTEGRTLAQRASTRPPAARYRPLEGDGDQGVAMDTLLGRRVLLEPCDEARAAWLRRLARADGPHLQAVLDLDLEAGRCVLELPLGEPLSERTRTDEERDRARAQVLEAVERLHAAGVTHGDIGPHSVLLGPGRAVLLLPRSATGATVDEDLAAVRRL